ncbi:aldehyde oxidase GLOX1-like [Amaranthus tricolor]|uniref:aldehyde oxidase GLOX1-like n=1 Tax=Amaranthus tricolor TaxID=29722 RepID=UPI00258D3B30|nr:aldehyde oxidase GLOX1-like [Amaranthus tricolor]XP_057522777.1 aldehyde oxidase GLOX1-like [Amaranthus tricolor]XP_057522778.1 aldehyde oxidase GLOX1-like [Amaranthus tricolor]XP_057522779.1 aldehyde oxidase GLOX1-like [Amaranthus tricolor]XP_057522780.1 aldehyde oxidase GLOX1-like [Amaranthus tricolor]XP_057522781.1 aldehyde oxidase GLOX1-like [Amaranthus tricolor]XP_057522782.1 aldehyde oxidase GLOX1-like [Amaranthus tricolor]XP_057522783.1 aldehyde oxidase GLOX1-like [Amaranthus trico
MSHILLLFTLLLIFLPCSFAASNGQWQLVHENIGISAMHMQLLNDDRVIILDRTDFGPSNISLPHGQCRKDPNDLTLKIDCTAHSVLYDTHNNTVRPLTVLTDTWCSSGTMLPNGTLVQTGGYNDGDRGVRTFQPSCESCDLVELPNKLFYRRWYATNHVLPDGRFIIIGGRRAFNYEFYPKSRLYNLPFLAQTNDPHVENNLYPFVFLNIDGNLFIFANNRAILLDYNKNLVVRTYPAIPGGDPRSYPSSGSAVLLPLRKLEMGLKVEAEVLICGGAPNGSYLKAHVNQFLPALNTCARININDPKPIWVMETMPMSRVMSDMLILANGDILIINGARSGCAGWEFARDPILSPVVYHPNNSPGSRFEMQNPSQISRMYHSSAILLRDGRILVGGSNPHKYDQFGPNVLYPTDLTLEAFLPPYLDPNKVDIRPVIVSPDSGSKIHYEEVLEIKFTITGLVDPSAIQVTMLNPPFNTHSFSMSQRLLVLANIKPPTHNLTQFQYNVTTPGSTKIAPPGFYLLFVVHQNVPSIGIWVRLM